MGEHTLYGKRRLCYTEVSDYTDYQGIGHDPLYKRYDSVFSVIKDIVDTQYLHFLAQPVHSNVTGQIEWYIEDWNELPKRYTRLKAEEREKYKTIKEDTIGHYKKCLANADGEDLLILASALKYIDNESIYCYDDKIALVTWGMKPDTNQHKITGAVIHEFPNETKHKLFFNSGESGSLQSKLDRIMYRYDGFEISSKDLPLVTTNKEYEFIGWEPNPIGMVVKSDMMFKAQYSVVAPKTPIVPTDTSAPIIDSEDTESKETVIVTFLIGDYGIISNGEDKIEIEKGEILNKNQIPTIDAIDGKIFVGWNQSIDNPVNKDTVFTALYDDNETNVEPPLVVAGDDDEKEEPWYRRLWILFAGSGCLKWLLWILLFLLLLFLLLLLLRSCNSCSREDGAGSSGAEIVQPIDTITTPDGEKIDDNNNRDDINIIEEDGTLPDDSSPIIAPIVGEDGEQPPIIEEQPGMPKIIANRLNIFFENEDVDLDAFVQDFKKVYTSDKYQIIGFDKNVKMIQIQIPESERNSVRETINSKLSNYKFFVVDESIFQIVGDVNGTNSGAGWHLDAINLTEAWEISKGDTSVLVAVVDDGIDFRHSMFEGRIINAYNVFTQNNQLSVGEGHGTHVAGLAVGSGEYFTSGASGVAPKCKIMPVQVFDNKICTFSTITSGIMYAIHEGADVVNVSIGPSFKGLSELPVEVQKEIARTQFKNEEKVWRRIIQIANKNNCILVFAVGNDKVLANLPPENRTNSSVNVAAVDKSFSVASFSNYGEGSNISAPGVDIYSSFPGNDFQYCDGTSMAAPIVAGTIALMKSIDEDITVEQVISVLQKTGKHMSGNVPPMVLVDKALQVVKSGDYETLLPDDSSNSNKQDGGENTQNPNPDTEDTIQDESENTQQDTTDYEWIRKLIEEYKRKIDELEKQLPENKK